MFSPLRNRLGIPGLISVIALVFAMGGGAYAANGGGDGADASAKKKNRKGKNAGLTGKQKRQVIQIARREAKKFPGPAGPAGVTGLPGAPGSDGSDGDDGSDGSNGKSVALVNEEPAGCPEEEGVTYEIEGSGEENEVCNGEEGSPWTELGTLPSGESLTGSWAIGKGSPSDRVNTAISFPIPLAEGLFGGDPAAGEGCQALGDPAQTEPDEDCQVHYINPAGEELFFSFSTGPDAVAPTHCGEGIGPEVDAANPQADPGHLCVYAAEHVGIGTFGTPMIQLPGLGGPPSVGAGGGASAVGAKLTVYGPSTTTVEAWGTWAVTAP